MNAQKFTQKSLEAIQEAQNIALEHNSMQIEQEHLVCALLEQKDGLIPQLMKKMGTDPDALLHAVEQRIEGLPGVTGPGACQSGKDCGFDEGRICFRGAHYDGGSGKAEHRHEPYFPAVRRDKGPVPVRAGYGSGQYPGHQRHPGGNL